MFNSSNQAIVEPDETVKIQFFEFLSQENIQEITNFFRNESYEVWNFRDNEEFTALHKATFLNFTRVVHIILNEMKLRLGTSAKKAIIKFVNEKNNQGFTAIHYASYRGNIEVINKLIENGAEIESTNNRGLNVLHMAAEGNQPCSLVYFKEKYLLNIHSIDELGSTPLHWACYTGSEVAVCFLLSWNGEINMKDKEGLTPLHLAVISERVRIIKKLIQNGADRKIKDSKGRTAYDIAMNKSKVALAELLQEKAACQLCNVNFPLQKEGKSRLNVIFFLTFHFLVEITVYFSLLPFLDNHPLTYLYMLLIILVLLSFIWLIWSDPGILSNEENKHFLALVEENVNINDYCPKCIVKKPQSSRHCVICDKCIKGFDHHCYWINNCIGEKNIGMFCAFLILTIFNVFFNIAIAVMCVAIDEHTPTMDEDRFPPLLTFLPGLYEKSIKIVVSAIVFLFGVAFSFPLTCLLLFQIKKCIAKSKKLQPEQQLDIRRATESILGNDKGGLLLQNEVSDDSKWKEGENISDKGNATLFKIETPKKTVYKY